MDRSTDPAILIAALRQDLGTFVAKVFQTVSPGDVYLDNWHIDAIVYQLMLVYGGDIRRLIITQPPRSLKSICTSVSFVAWCLGHDPTKRFACASYSLELAATFARQFRAVVTSDWYQVLFPRMRLAKDTETECVTTRGGGRFAVAVAGSFTGRGADVIIIDDPLKADEAHSEKARRAVNEWYKTTLLSRLDDKEKGAIIGVAQRLHEDDLPGMLLREGDWQHLDLPAIAEEDQDIPIGPDAVHHRKKGEALHAEREPIEVLERIKSEMGSLAFAAQYQQRPVPVEGNLVKREWIQWYETAPNLEPGVRVIQSWDVASTTGDTNDWSVCTTWAVAKRNYFLLDVWRGRLEFPRLKQKLIDLALDYRPHTILIERAGPGLHLIQEFQANSVKGVAMPIGIRPEGDKVDRMAAQSARFEAGQVFLPREAPWLSELLHEILGFPHARNDDQIDSVSQFLNWIESRRDRKLTVSPLGPKIIYG
jgi:predicted phage terminase large subunit-like protein